MSSRRPIVLYWDSSAVLSALVHETHSQETLRRLRAPGHHLISSLALAETHAVLSRMCRDGLLSEEELPQVRANLAAGPWEKVSVTPDTELVPALADRHRLRGADLWHLALAVSLSRDLPELRLLTWDAQLRTAATTEGL